jgi:hypothetical protein
MNTTLTLLSAPLFVLAALAQEPTPAVPPQYVGAPLDPQHAVTNARHQGIPSLAVSPKGASGLLVRGHHAR